MKTLAQDETFRKLVHDCRSAQMSEYENTVQLLVSYMEENRAMCEECGLPKHSDVPCKFAKNWLMMQRIFG